MPITHRSLAALVWLLGAVAAQAATADAPPEPKPDAAPCLAAIAAGDDDKIIAVCTPLLGNDKFAVADRLKALPARAAAYARKDQADLAIADYTAALKIELMHADWLNARGELLRKQGDRPGAIRDFQAAMRIDRTNEVAHANYKDLALEIERLGAHMPLKPPPKPPLK